MIFHYFLVLLVGGETIGFPLEGFHKAALEVCWFMGPCKTMGEKATGTRDKEAFFNIFTTTAAPAVMTTTTTFEPPTEEPDPSWSLELEVHNSTLNFSLHSNSTLFLNVTTLAPVAEEINLIQERTVNSNQIFYGTLLILSVTAAAGIIITVAFCAVKIYRGRKARLIARSNVILLEELPFRCVSRIEIDMSDESAPLSEADSESVLEANLAD